MRDSAMSPYQILGVARGSTPEEIKQAFLLKVQAVHPDHGGDDPSFIELRTAYEQILDELKRRPAPSATSSANDSRNVRARNLANSSVAQQSYSEWVGRLSAKSARTPVPWYIHLLKVVGISFFLSLIVAMIVATYFAWTWDPEEAARAPGSQEDNASTCTIAAFVITFVLFLPITAAVSVDFD
jgi:DnaJ domain